MLKQMYHGLQYKFSDTQQVHRSSQAPTRKELAACRGAGGVQVTRWCGAAAFKRREDAIDGEKKDTNRRDPTFEYGESKIASLLVYSIFKEAFYFYKVLFPLYVWLRYTWAVELLLYGHLRIYNVKSILVTRSKGILIYSATLISSLFLPRSTHEII